MAKNKEKNLKNNFKFEGNNPEYEFQLKKKPNLWWLLLLLLPLVLLIPLKKDITVYTTQDGNSEPFVDVSMNYTSRYLLWNKKFNVKISCDTIQQTDSTGYTVFKDLGYSVYSFIFHFNAPAVFSAGGEGCYDSISKTCRFHTTRQAVLNMSSQLTDVRLKVVDKELDFVIPGANVFCEFIGKDGRCQTSDTTDAAGCVLVKDARVCSEFNSIKVSAEGYADTLLSNLQVIELLKNAGGYVIPLRPLKDRFIFYVKNVYTKEPIPEALAEVSLTFNGQKGTVGTRTNVDGLGQGFYDNARVLAKISIKASKQGYYDSIYVAPKGKPNPITVRDFIKLDSIDRVVWLQPKPIAVQFRNIDTLSNQPIAGVTNKIVVNGIDGKTRTYPSTSNRNGYFDVTALPGDKITIVSTLDPYYHPKTTVIGKYEKGEIIYMNPVLVDLTFRTVEMDNGTMKGVLPDCNLVVTVDGQRVNPTNSGSGTFVVPKLRLTSKISIEASKTDYLPNNTKIQNKSVEYLAKAQQDERDIPLEKMPTLTFRTIDKNSGNVLAGCTFVPTGSITGKLKYTEKTPGVFDVTFRKDEQISITASKTGYGTNSKKVRNASYSQLQTQNDRDIPLAKNWEYHHSLSDGLGSNYTETKCYDLYDAPVSFLFTWTLCSGCTKITITDDNGKIIQEIGYKTSDNSGSGSKRWTSPTRKICVSVDNENGHPFGYDITQ